MGGGGVMRVFSVRGERDPVRARAALCIYPDCRQERIKAFRTMLNLCTTRSQHSCLFPLLVSSFLLCGLFYPCVEYEGEFTYELILGHVDLRFGMSVLTSRSLAHNKPSLFFPVLASASLLPISSYSPTLSPHPPLLKDLNSPFTKVMGFPCPYSRASTRP